MSVLLSVVIGVVAGFCVMLAANLSTTIYLHRTLSHRALTMRRPLGFGFRAFIWIATGIRPRQWVAVHRKHHAFTDEPGDPHSPKLLGWVNVQMKNVALYRKEANNPDTVARYAKDLPPDRWDTLLFDHALLGLGIGIALLVVVLGPVAGLTAAFVHMNLYLGTSAAVNAIGHRFGRRPYDNGAGNLQWLAFLTAGEGLHNNHHAAPTSARLSHRRWEFDPGWWVIRSFKALGLVKLRLSEAVLVAKARRRPIAGDALGGMTGEPDPQGPESSAAAHAMQIVSAVFVEDFNMRQAPGPSTRIDLTGVMFSMAAPSPVPVTLDPHLVALIYCPPDVAGSGVFEVVFRRGLDETDEQVARNVSPFTVEPGKFTYRLVRGELEFSDYGQVVAHCRVDRGPWHMVPFTLLPPA